MPKHTHASARVSARNKAPSSLPVTPKKPKGCRANNEHSLHVPSVGLPITPVSQPRSNGKRSRKKNDEVTIILSDDEIFQINKRVKEETVAVTPMAKKVLGLNIRGSSPERAVSDKIRKVRKKVIIKEESEDDEVYNKPLAIEEAEEADNNDIGSDASVIYHSDADQGYGGQFEKEEEEDDEEDETDTNIDWPSSDKDHDITSVSRVKKVEDDVNNQKAKPKGKSYVANKKQILLAPPG
ncbi:hypothetical protein M422DRAFT_276026, partial [Sphaerobolus stellatus SS14]